MKIVCPRCGEVTQYQVVRHIRCNSVYDISGQDLFDTDHEIFYVGRSKRCVHCNYQLTFEGDDQV